MSDNWTDRITRVAKDIGWPHADARCTGGGPDTATLYMYAASHTTVSRVMASGMTNDELGEHLKVKLDKAKADIVKLVTGD